MKEADWTVTTYPSGTLVVKALGVDEGAHYRIGHPRRRNDLADRYATAKSLEKWLNGAERSDLLNVLIRTKPNEVLLQNGVPITASALNRSEDGEIMCWRLIEGLVTGEVPDV